MDLRSQNCERRHVSGDSVNGSTHGTRHQDPTKEKTIDKALVRYLWFQREEKLNKQCESRRPATDERISKMVTNERRTNAAASLWVHREKDLKFYGSHRDVD